VDVVELLACRYRLQLGIANAHLWTSGDGVTLVDSGPAGSGPAIRAALEQLGLRREDVRRVVVTHFHDDHAGPVAEVASWAGACIVAGRADAPVSRGVEAPAGTMLHRGRARLACSRSRRTADSAGLRRR
jgi:glyoxylase-like metal-dependent hydrolase (beta-lactamase superfamily II)